MSRSGKSKGFRSVVAAILVSLCVISAVYGVFYVLLLKPADFEHIVPVSGEGTGYYRHYYDELNQDEQFVYSVILQEIRSYPDRIEIPSLDNCDLSKIYEALSMDNPDLIGLAYNCSSYKLGNKTYFIPKYELSYEEYEEYLSETEKQAEFIVAEAQKYDTDYERELYVHDYIISNCTYVAPEEGHCANTVYGCLVQKRASCEGYARAFQYIMNKLDIDNRLVTGESADDGVNYVGHMWNYVVIDGEGYFVDVTWDDPRSDSEVLRHTYLNFTTADMFVNYRNIDQNLPLCSALRYNYFVYEGAYFNVGSGENFRALVTASVTEAVTKQYSCVELRFSDNIVAEQAKNTLFNSGMIYEIYQSMGLISVNSESQIYYSTDTNMNTVCIFF